MPEPRREPFGGLWPLLLALVVVLPAGLLAMVERFDGLYGQDPFAYFGYATGPLRESLLGFRSPPPFFWPPGYPFLVALASLPLGPVPLAGQLVSLVAGGMVPVFTALLARELWTEPGDSTRSRVSVPLAAGLAAALTGQLWQSSTVVMSDTTGLALATAGMWALARYGRGARGLWLLLAAGLLCGATLTRWVYGLVVIPATLYSLTALARRSTRQAMAHATAAALLVVALLGPVLVPALDGLLRGDGGPVAFGGNFQVHSWSPSGAVQREFTTVDGRLRHPLPNGVYYALAPARWAYFTPLLAPLILPGVWSMLRRRHAALSLLVGGWAAVVYAFHAGAAYQNFRFTLAYLPPLAILIGIGAARLTQLARGVSARVVAAHLSLGLLLMTAAAVHTTRVLVERKNESLDTVRWAAARMPPDARLLTFGLTLTFRHYTALQVLELFDLDAGRIAAGMERDLPTFLLADTLHLNDQWKGLPPERSFRSLQEEPGLRLVDRRGEHVLFLVGSPSGGAR